MLSCFISKTQNQNFFFSSWNHQEKGGNIFHPEKFLVNSNEYNLKSYIIWLGSLKILVVFTPEMEQFTPGATGEPCHAQLTLLTKSFTQESPWGTEDITTDKQRERFRTVSVFIIVLLVLWIDLCAYLRDNHKVKE